MTDRATAFTRHINPERRPALADEKTFELRTADQILAMPDNGDFLSQFMDLMQRCMADLVRATGSNVLGWSDPQRATESERAGRA